MIVIENDMDLDILISSREIKSAMKDEKGNTDYAKTIKLEAIAKGSERKVIVEYDPHSRPLNTKRIESRREKDVLILEIYNELYRIESKESIYNNEPIQDRYDGENKAVIYSDTNLPLHLKNYFGLPLDN